MSICIKKCNKNLGQFGAIFWKKVQGNSKILAYLKNGHTLKNLSQNQFKLCMQHKVINNVSEIVIKIWRNIGTVFEKSHRLDSLEYFSNTGQFKKCS